VEELQSLDVDTLTPLEALNRLADFKRRAGERSPKTARAADERR
jgi:hypothetical protein